jgi:hypothetical protein
MQPSSPPSAANTCLPRMQMSNNGEPEETPKLCNGSSRSEPASLGGSDCAASEDGSLSWRWSMKVFPHSSLCATCLVPPGVLGVGEESCTSCAAIVISALVGVPFDLSETATCSEDQLCKSLTHHEGTAAAWGMVTLSEEGIDVAGWRLVERCRARLGRCTPNAAAKPEAKSVPGLQPHPGGHPSR